MKGTACLRKRGRIALLGLALALATTACQPGWTASMAGAGTSGSAGDAGPATEATLQAPQGVVAIPGGGFYVADASACVIRKIDGAGVISTVAGTGACGSTGDGGPAVAARISFNDIHQLALDAAGDLWFASGAGFGLRRVGVAGLITSPDVGQIGPIGGLTNGPDGTVYFLDNVASATPRVRAIDSAGTVTTRVTLANAWLPAALGYVSPSEFVMTFPNAGTISRVDVATATATPTGARAVDAMFATLAAASDGTIYAPAADGVHVQRIDPDNTVTLIAGSGLGDPATGVQRGIATGLALTPVGLALTPNNGLLISSGHVVYRLDQPKLAG